MAKINVVLVIMNEKSLLNALNSLNFDNANLAAAVMEDGNGKTLKFDDKEIPLYSFSAVENLANAEPNLIWLISGRINGVSDIDNMKRFLISSGVPEGNIINFEMLIQPKWIANLHYIEEYGADFFATGMSYTEHGLDLDYIPYKGVNLSSPDQDLQQSYLTAKYIFEHVDSGAIKFVLIGLAPYSLRYDNAQDFSSCSRNLQYMFALNISEQNQLLQALVSDDVKNIFTTTTEQADLNFIKTRNASDGEISVETIVNWTGGG